MTTRELASAYRLAQWAEKLREQKASGQSIRQWCEANGIKRQRYFYWQRKIRMAASEHLPEIQGDGMETGLSVPSGFAQVQLAAPAVQPQTDMSEQVQLEFGEVQLTVGSGYPVEQLARLVRELAGRC